MLLSGGFSESRRPGRSPATNARTQKSPLHDNGQLGKVIRCVKLFPLSRVLSCEIEPGFEPCSHLAWPLGFLNALW